MIQIKPYWYTLAALGAMILCAGCGSKDDFSGSGELSKMQNQKPPTALPSGGALVAHPPMMVNQKRPPGTGG